ncbi:MAG TPA: copper resistance protein CopC [Gaiellaceae bacterium]|nr:copper resistance protein CopC [Gaiellaceae bacterium]
MKRLFAVVLVALAAPSAAWAHATLQSTSPKVGERLEASPRTIRLTFDQTVKVLPNGIQVVDAKGHLVSGRPRVSPTDPRVVEAPLRTLPRGGYTVRWATISNDSHVGRGVFTFGVRTAAPPISEAYGASGPTTSEHVVRWLYFVALAALTGGLGFRLFVLRGSITPEVERRFYRLTGIGVVAALEIGIVAFLLRAEDALQLPLTGFLYGDLSPFANATRFGQAFVAMELGFAIVAALLYLAWLTGRQILLRGAFLLALGLGSGLSLSSHQSDDRGWLPSFADWAHLSAATLWIGGLLSLALVVWNDRALRRTAFWRFSEVAGPLVAIVVAAGVYMTFKRFPALDDLWDVGYGRLLLVKLGLVAVALSWGAFHHLVVRPRLDRPGVAKRLPSSIAGEAAVAVSILLLAAILVDSKPPSKPSNTVSQAANATLGAGLGASNTMLRARR